MERNSFRRCLMAALLLVAGACQTTQADDEAETIRALRVQSNEAFARHDTVAIRSFLHDDFVITISTGDIERSRDEHVRGLEQWFAEYPDVVYVRTPSTITLSDSYPLAMEQGTWAGSRTSKNGKTENGGQYTAAWRRTGAGWKLYSELFVGFHCKGPDC